MVHEGQMDQKILELQIQQVSIYIYTAITYQRALFNLQFLPLCIPTKQRNGLSISVKLYGLTSLTIMRNIDS